MSAAPIVVVQHGPLVRWEEGAQGERAGVVWQNGRLAPYGHIQSILLNCRTPKRSIRNQ